MTTKSGEPICFVFNNSTGCREPCPNGRVHVCQICLGIHSAVKCPEKEGELKRENASGSEAH
eukprot:4175600-Amphidinium_carterae.1